MYEGVCVILAAEPGKGYDTLQTLLQLFEEAADVALLFA